MTSYVKTCCAPCFTSFETYFPKRGESRFFGTFNFLRRKREKELFWGELLKGRKQHGATKEEQVFSYSILNIFKYFNFKDGERNDEIKLFFENAFWFYIFNTTNIFEYLISEEFQLNEHKGKLFFLQRGKSIFVWFIFSTCDVYSMAIIFFPIFNFRRGSKELQLRIRLLETKYILKTLNEKQFLLRHFFLFSRSQV